MASPLSAVWQSVCGDVEILCLSAGSLNRPLLLSFFSINPNVLPWRRKPRTTAAPPHAERNTTAVTRCVAVARRAKPWKLGCTTGHGQPPRARPVRARQQERVRDAIAPATRRLGLPATAPGVRGAAAGRAGCWWPRLVPAPGLTNPGGDASAMEGNRWRRRAQSEGLAGRTGLSRVRREAQGARQVGQVGTGPAGEAEAHRPLPRDCATLQQERARMTPRIQGWRRSPGRRGTRLTTWPAPRAAWRRWAASPMPPGRRRRVRRVDAPPPCLSPQRAAGEAARRALRPPSQEAPSAPVRPLRPLQGRGRQGAWGLGRAWCGGRAGQPRRAVGGGAGGTPTPSQSGARVRAPGSPQAGPRHGRRRTPAGARRGRRLPPARAWRGWFRARLGGGGTRGRRRGMVAGARQGRLALGRFLATGGVPAGAGRTEADTLWRGGRTRRPGGWGRRPVAGPGLPGKPS
jgi:transposase